MLYLYGLKSGIAAAIKGRFSKEVLKNILVPVNYWRTLEYRIVFDELQVNAHDRILDLSSPKLLSLYLADKFGADVYAADIEDYFIESYRAFQRDKHIPEHRFHPQTADGRKLEFADNFFSKIYSISVLEHIPDEGDTTCIKELARVLDRNGKCVITVPFAPDSTNEFRDSGDFYWSGSSKVANDTKKVFFQRRYSEDDLFNRLIKPSGLKLSKLQYVGETCLPDSKKELADYLRPMMGPIHPLCSYIFHTSPTDDWRKLSKPLLALLVLEKIQILPTFSSR